MITKKEKNKTIWIFETEKEKLEYKNLLCRSIEVKKPSINEKEKISKYEIDKMINYAKTNNLQYYKVYEGTQTKIKKGYEIENKSDNKQEKEYINIIGFIQDTPIKKEYNENALKWFELLFSFYDKYQFKPTIESMKKYTQTIREKHKIRLNAYHEKLYKELWIYSKLKKLKLNDSSFTILKPKKKRKEKIEFIPNLENIKFSNKLITKIYWVNPFTQNIQIKTYSSNKKNKKTPTLRLIHTPIIRGFKQDYNLKGINDFKIQEKVIQKIEQIRKKDISYVRDKLIENEKYKINSTKYKHNLKLINNKINVIYDIKPPIKHKDRKKRFTVEIDYKKEYYLDYEGINTLYRLISNKYKKEFLQYISDTNLIDGKTDKTKYPLLNLLINELNIIRKRTIRKQVTLKEKRKQTNLKPRKLKNVDITNKFLENKDYTEKQILEVMEKWFYKLLN